MSYTEAREKYAVLGVDADAAMEKLKTVPVSLYCWQGDDVRGFDTDSAKPLPAASRPRAITPAGPGPPGS